MVETRGKYEKPYYGDSFLSKNVFVLAPLEFVVTPQQHLRSYLGGHLDHDNEIWTKNAARTQ